MYVHSTELVNKTSMYVNVYTELMINSVSIYKHWMMLIMTKRH